MLKTAVLGYPRIGAQRQLKKATESFWKGEISEEALESAARELRQERWQAQNLAGADLIPSNDFSFYDPMLDMTALLGAMPARFGWKGGTVGLGTYFAMARGIQEKEGLDKKSVPAMEMTKWFDTNYHYIVPEFHKGQRFSLASEKPFREFREALDLGITTRPVLVGPVTWLLLGKSKDKGFSPLEHLDRVLEVYLEVLLKLRSLGAESVQVDEPVLATDLSAEAARAFRKSYKAFADRVPDLFIWLTPYFGTLGRNLALVSSLPVGGVHLDLTKAPKDLAAALRWPGSKKLSLGIIDGRNIWKNDFQKSLKLLKPAVKKLGPDRAVIATSCSLVHAPLDLELETALDADLRRWLSFAAQKLGELQVLRRALTEGERAVSAELQANRKDIESRARSPKIHRPDVAKRLRAVGPKDLRRKNPFRVRRVVQKERLGFPLYPTTTIGSFPQTADVRNSRAQFRAGKLSGKEYDDFLKTKIKDCVARQEDMGLDVLVHGEFERNDMVEYFGEMLEGFAFTRSGWVQSYGTRYVKPPVIFGDVARPQPMTVEWTRYAQSLTSKPVKGMLTGPITILQWSFVRDDQPRSVTARQIALAIRDEVRDLEKAGACVIQIDEPAIREGLPLRRSDWAAYLKWAVDAFRLASSGVEDKTQIHTHMCYSEFNDIIRPIAAMDADVISIETSRSQMELLGAFVKFRYPNEIGPGVYDIHSPRVPSAEEIKALLAKAGRLLPPGNIWVNPDCGLKTRGWEETTLSLKAMVKAARELRGSSKPRAKEKVAV